MRIGIVRRTNLEEVVVGSKEKSKSEESGVTPLAGV